MKLRSAGKGLLAMAVFTLAVAAAPLSLMKAEAAQGTYTVEKRDCLSKIARKVYGDELLWKAIYNANSGTVKKDYIIYPGQVLVIPEIDGKPAQTQETPAPAQNQETPAPTQSQDTSDQSQEFVLDYNQLASWINSGFVGTNTTNETVVFATDSESDYGIILFADNSNMTAASFVGAITYNGEYMTITDETNGLALTCSVKEVSDGTLALDMGDLGVATVSVQTRENVLESIKTIIEKYSHVA